MGFGLCGNWNPSHDLCSMPLGQSLWTSESHGEMGIENPVQIFCSFEIIRVKHSAWIMAPKFKKCLQMSPVGMVCENHGLCFFFLIQNQTRTTSKPSLPKKRKKTKQLFRTRSPIDKTLELALLKMGERRPSWWESPATWVRPTGLLLTLQAVWGTLWTHKRATWLRAVSDERDEM